MSEKKPPLPCGTQPSENTQAYAKRKKTLPKDDPDYSVTPFDDVIRIAARTMKKRIILLMNRIFGTHFTGDETLELKPTEEILLDNDGNKMRRMDAHFTIVEGDGQRHVFHLECQANPDGSIVMRFAEYDLQIAIESGTEDEQGMRHLYLPNSVLLNLRRPRRAHPLAYTLHLGDQTLVNEIRELNMSDWTAEDLLAADMLALLPFHLFTHKGSLRKLADDPQTAETLVEEFQWICDRLAEMEEEGKIQAFEHGMLLELMRKADRNAAPESVMEQEVTKVANRRLAELETEKIYNSGMEFGEERGLKLGEERGLKLGEERGLKLGEERGLERGEENGRREMIFELVRERIITASQGAAKLQMTEDELKQAMAM